MTEWLIKYAAQLVLSKLASWAAGKIENKLKEGKIKKVVTAVKSGALNSCQSAIDGIKSKADKEQSKQDIRAKFGVGRQNR